ncbi:hypothetical protein J6590_067672 [Homalodisca vitripennis]|nr:hypothetical protein J6590_067672 [Homalodisca vitripennis]
MVTFLYCFFYTMSNGSDQIADWLNDQLSDCGSEIDYSPGVEDLDYTQLDCIEDNLNDDQMLLVGESTPENEILPPRPKKSKKGPSMIWETMEGYIPERIEQTNLYAEQERTKKGMVFGRRSRDWDWKPVTVEEILELIKGLIEKYGSEVKRPVYGRPSIEPKPKRLVERHFIENIPPTEKKSKPYRVCVQSTIISTENSRSRQLVGSRKSPH